MIEQLALPMNLLVVVLLAAITIFMARAYSKRAARVGAYFVLICCGWAVSVPYLFLELIRHADRLPPPTVLTPSSLLALRISATATALHMAAVVHRHSPSWRRALLLGATIAAITAAFCVLLARGTEAHPDRVFFTAAVAFLFWSAGGLVVLSLSLNATFQDLDSAGSPSHRSLITVPLYVYAFLQLTYLPHFLDIPGGLFGLSSAEIQKAVRAFGFVAGFGCKGVHFAGLWMRVSREAIALSALAVDQARIAQQSRLFSKALHELKTPTAELNLVLEHLERDVISRQNVKATTAATGSTVTRILAIIEGTFELVAAGRLGPGQERDSRRSVKLPTFVEAAALTVKSTYPLIDTTPDVRIEHDCHYSSRVLVNCRPFAIMQALVNVIRNAYDAMMPAGGTLRLTVRWDDESGSSSGQTALIQIEDDGHGIGEKDLSRVYADGFTTREPKEGRGHGLPIASAIVGEHGGTITHTSPAPRTGRGTLVEIRFPAKPLP